MDILNLPEQAREVITAEPWRAIENAMDYAWRVDEEVLDMYDIMRAKNEILKALFEAKTPALDRVLAVMAKHDPNMENTEV